MSLAERKRTSVHTHAYIHTCIHAYIYTFKYRHTYMHTYIRKYIHTNLLSVISTIVCVYTYACNVCIMSMYVHLFINACTPVYVHVHPYPCTKTYALIGSVVRAYLLTIWISVYNHGSNKPCCKQDETTLLHTCQYQH